jgi:transcription elongation factor Elf1
MLQLIFECRKCKKKTRQSVRIVTDNLPDNVKVLECSVCGIMGVALIGDDDGQL